MLVLTRKYGQQIMIGDNIVITVLEARGDAIRIGVEAPECISVKRAEVYDAVRAENLAALETGTGTPDSLGQVLSALNSTHSPSSPHAGPERTHGFREEAPVRTGPGHDQKREDNVWPPQSPEPVSRTEIRPTRFIWLPKTDAES